MTLPAPRQIRDVGFCWPWVCCWHFGQQVLGRIHWMPGTNGKLELGTFQQHRLKVSIRFLIVFWHHVREKNTSSRLLSFFAKSTNYEGTTGSYRKRVIYPWMLWILQGQPHPPRLDIMPPVTSTFNICPFPEVGSSKTVGFLAPFALRKAVNFLSHRVSRQSYVARWRRCFMVFQHSTIYLGDLI